jgi:undecaprenyl-diphosphatase
MDLYLLCLSLVQAVTEFLPVSSSAHLLLMAKIFSADHMTLEWEVALHFGTVLAVIVYFHKELWAMALSCIRVLQSPKNACENFQKAMFLVCATVPTVCIGFVVKKVGVPSFSLEAMAFITAAFGIFLYGADSLSGNQQSFTFKKAFLLGLAQSAAFVPGVSRSGICITAARLMGISKSEAVNFSFLLSIPVVMGAVTMTGLDMMKVETFIDWGVMMQAITLTFFLGLCMIHFLLWYVSRFSFLLFMVYRILLGVGIFFFVK